MRRRCAAWLAVDLPLALTLLGAWSAYLAGFFTQRAGYGSLWVLPQLAQQAVGAQDDLGAARRRGRRR